MFGITDAMRSVSTARPEMSVFHALSFGKIRQPANIVPGPGVPPPELLVLLVVPPDDDDVDAAPPALVDVELAPPLDDDVEPFPALSSLPPHATTMPIPNTTTADPLMMRS
jgi:hypothetical protein